MVGVWTREHWKNLGLLLLSATVEASNFKFGTQLQFGKYVTITNLVSGLAGLQEHLRIVGITYSVPNTLYHVTATEM